MKYLLLSQAFAFNPPEVNIVQADEKQEVWLIQDARSPWSVAHICFQSQETIPSLLSLETLLSLRISEEAEEFLAHGVELHQRVGQDELCLQIGALKEEMEWALDQSVQLIQETRWKRKSWIEIQELYHQELQKEAGRLASLHQLAEHVIWADEHWVDWDWKFWKINRSYRRFQKISMIKIVVVGDWTKDELQQVLPQLPARKKRTKKSKISASKDIQRPECALVEIEGFPQVAISQRFSFPELDATQLQYLSIILGYGTRSRLMEELREERGLLYSLGAQVQGQDIVVRYSLPPESVQEAMVAVSDIISALSSQPITEMEFQRARGILSQRYYRTLEDYQQLAALHTVYSRPNSWTNIAQKRIAYSYDELAKQAQFSDYSSIITGLSKAEMDELQHCQKIEEIAFSQLVELKSLKD